MLCAASFVTSGTQTQKRQEESLVTTVFFCSGLHQVLPCQVFVLISSVRQLCLFVAAGFVLLLDSFRCKFVLVSSVIEHCRLHVVFSSFLLLIAAVCKLAVSFLLLWGTVWCKFVFFAASLELSLARLLSSSSVCQERCSFVFKPSIHSDAFKDK